VSNIAVEQATFSRAGEADPVLLARSPGFRDDWRAPLQHLLLAFGARPVGVACPSAVFAQPLDRNFVAVVHVADLNEPDTAARPLGFHVLVVPRKAYALLWHDPFTLAERLPPDWAARDALPAVTWPDAVLPVRTVEQVRTVLKRVKGVPLPEGPTDEEQRKQHAIENSESPTLLGGAQILVDGGKLVFKRQQPDTDFVRALWTLLPNSVRGELWPASFAFSNELQFDVVVVPRFHQDEFAGYTPEDLAGEYPTGKYEHNLQVAAETGSQYDLNVLFERRSLKQTWRLGITLLIALSLIALLARCR
jgi:hypothetical protein